MTPSFPSPASSHGAGRANLLARLAAGLLLAFAPALVRAAHYDYFVIGNPAAAHAPAKTEGGLMLMGGSDDVDQAFRWLIGKSGGGRLVILRASGKDDYHKYLFNEIGGMVSVETIVFHDRAAANDPRVLDIIRHADGIFLAGGDQSNYIHFWKGTPVNDALNEHVRSGRPIGGTSAGLAILGHYSYGALDGGSITTATALKNPFSSEVTLEKDFLHFTLLENVITDSHFSARKRLGRLITFLARLTSEEKNPHLYGIGVDEKTALCIEADGTAHLFTGAKGRAWLVFPQQPASRLEPGQPLGIGGVRVISLDLTSRFDLKTLKIDQPASQATVSAADGKLIE